MTIKQYVLDALGKFWTKLKSTYVTNCASTSNNLALAASQGKVLQDQITALNSSYGTFPSVTTNIDTYEGNHIFWCNNNSTGTLPTLLDGNSWLIISRVAMSDGAVIYGTQIAIGFASLNVATRHHHYGTQNSWKPWTMLPSREEFTALAADTQLLYTSGVPTTATSYSLNQPFTNYNFLLLEFRQYSNIWAQYLLPTSYFDNTAEGSRPVLFYVDTNGARTTINVYKNTTSSVYVKSNVEYSTAYHVVIIGLYKK